MSHPHKSFLNSKKKKKEKETNLDHAVISLLSGNLKKKKRRLDGYQVHKLTKNASKILRATTIKLLRKHSGKAS